MDIQLVIAVVGTALTTISVVILIWRLTREKPRLEVEVISCQHKVRSDHKATIVGLKFRVHNKGDKATTLTRLDTKLSDTMGDEHTGTKELKTDIESHRSTEILAPLFLFQPPFQYPIILACTFTLHHTHGRMSFKRDSQESDEVLHNTGYVLSSSRGLNKLVG